MTFGAFKLVKSLSFPTPTPIEKLSYLGQTGTYAKMGGGTS